MVVTVKVRRLDWQHLVKGLTGEKALIAMIISQAYQDLIHGDIFAAAYFASKYYLHHLEILGLPPSWLPEGVEVNKNGPGLQLQVVDEQIIELRGET